MTSLSQIDLIVVIAYAIGIFGLAQWVSREKAGRQKDTSDYFLASKALPWWAIGAPLIAANISAERSSVCRARVMRWGLRSRRTNGWRR